MGQVFISSCRLLVAALRRVLAEASPESPNRQELSETLRYAQECLRCPMTDTASLSAAIRVSAQHLSLVSVVNAREEERRALAVARRAMTAALAALPAPGPRDPSMPQFSTSIKSSPTLS